MKVSLDGLISNAGSCLKCSRDSYGPMYAFVLEELRDHIKGLVNGKHTIEQFADFYCIKRDAAAKGEVHRLRDLIDEIADMGLGEPEMEMRLIIDLCRHEQKRWTETTP